MSDRYLYGADTLIIPFKIVGGSMSPRRSFGMSRMRPAGELFRYGVVNSQTSDEHEKATVGGCQHFGLGGDAVRRSHYPAQP